jgi:hypothetical protein
MTAELYVWKAPRPNEVSEAEELVRAQRAFEAKASPEAVEPGSPFIASDDVTWFSRELTGDAPPVWNPDRPATREHPDRFMAVALDSGSRDELRELLSEVYSLATKYDLMVYDPIRGVINRPQKELADHASATFWPRGAIRAFVAGAGGAILATAAWFLGIPILSGIAIVIGVFLLVLAGFTFVYEGRVALRGRSKPDA